MLPTAKELLTILYSNCSILQRGTNNNQVTCHSCNGTFKRRCSILAENGLFFTQMLSRLDQHTYSGWLRITWKKEKHYNSCKLLHKNSFTPFWVFVAMIDASSKKGTQAVILWNKTHWGNQPTAFQELPADEIICWKKEVNDYSSVPTRVRLRN